MPETKQNQPEKIGATHAEVRMYRMGTGDCFVIKVFAGGKVTFKIMVDCGTWQGQKDALTPFVEDLKAYVGNQVDLLIVTHEHKDHVYVFEACEDLFRNNFTIGETWLAWTEDDEDKTVADWKEAYGNKKKALEKAVNKINSALTDPEFRQQFEGERDGNTLYAAKEFFAGALNSFADLQFSVNEAGLYAGNLKGMRVLKELSGDCIQYRRPGEIITTLEKTTGLKFYILGPPEKWNDVKMESGPVGESYEHNNKDSANDAFVEALTADGGRPNAAVLPFSSVYVCNEDDRNDRISSYKDKANTWRNIEYDWLNSSGSLALRVNSMTNNLSLAMAIEFSQSGRVMLFPGDAEYGSWKSWHDIPWDESKDGIHLTRDLLQRTVFYKVAHHLSHNGTARRLGMEMMTHADLTAMATLDYSVISKGWKGTMPNKGLIDGLLLRTKGRLLVMNENGIISDRKRNTLLTEAISNAKKQMTPAEFADFNNRYESSPLYLQYTVSAV